MATTSSFCVCRIEQKRIGWGSELHSAAANGHTECVRSLLQRGADVYIGTTENNITCLHLAAFLGHTEVVNLILHGKSPRRRFDKWPDDQLIPFLSPRERWELMEQKSSLGSFTALHLAVIGSHDQGVTIAASILEAYRTSVLKCYGLDSDPKVQFNIDDELWLDYLFQIRKYLHLQDGDDIDSKVASDPSSEDGESPWQRDMAANLESYGKRSGSELRKTVGGLQNYKGLVQSYVKLVSYSNARDKIGRTALHYAAWKNNVEVVKFLTWDTLLMGPNAHSQLGRVANVNIKDVRGYTPLHMASWKGSTDVAKVLLGDINVAAKDTKLNPRQNRLVKEMRLKPNAATRSTDISQLAFEAKEIQDALDKLGNGAQPLQLSSAESRDPFRLQDSVWDEERDGATPLHYAIEKEHTEIVELLVKHPYIDVFQCDSDGQSPWMIAFPPCLKLDKTPSENQTPRIASTSIAIQRLLRSGGSKESSWTKGKFKKHQSYRQHLLKKAATLAGEVDEEDPNIDAAFQFLELETQIFVTFLENITVIMGTYEKPPSTIHKCLKLIGLEKKKAKDFKRSVWEDEIESYLCRTSDMEKITLLHVAAFEGWGQELQKLLELKRFKDCVNDRENITGFQYTALHFATMYDKTNKCALAVLLNEKTLIPTIRNRKGLTPIRCGKRTVVWPMEAFTRRSRTTDGASPGEAVCGGSL